MDWKKYLFIKPALEQISQGPVFRKIYGIILKVLAVCTGIMGLVLWIYGWKTIFSSDDIGVILGGIIVEMLLIILIYALIHILLIRAEHIRDISEGNYAIIPIMSLSLKLAGEIYACILVFLGVGGGIFHWLAGGSLANFFQNPYLLQLPEFNRMGSVFISGLETMIWGALGAFGVLVLFYFLAELTIILVDIATDLKKRT